VGARWGLWDPWGWRLELGTFASLFWTSSDELMTPWTSYVYVGHVWTLLATLCVLWTCIDGFEDHDVWIHVETEFNAEMWFICYIIVNISDEMWVL
jgi:hypothetical protein